VHPALSHEKLQALGIYDFGVTTLSRPLSFDQFSAWIDKGDHGPLSYLADHRRDLREDIKKFFPEFQSALVFLFPYAQSRFEREDTPNHLASYVTGFKGLDYHHVIKERLELIGNQLKESDPSLVIKLSLDVHPVLERDLAYRAGLGWFGKNSMFISKELGSFVMLGSLLLSKEIVQETRELEVDHCGSCSACVPACPTDAITPDARTIVASKCISTWTIELFKDAPVIEGMERATGELFGCDLCQDVCPWNKRLERQNSYPQTHEGGQANELLADFFCRRPLESVASELEAMSNSGFRKKFKGTAIERTGRVGLLKNVQFWINQDSK